MRKFGNLVLSSLLIGAVLGGCTAGNIDVSSSSVPLQSSSSSAPLNTSSSIASSTVASSISSSLPASSSAASSLLASSSSSSVAPETFTFKIEEGDMAFCPFSGAVEFDHLGFTGTGYANGANVKGSKLLWAVSVDKAGSYTLAIRHANGGLEARSGVLSVGDQTATFNLDSTAEWTNWQTETRSIYLPAGDSIIALTAQTDSGLSNIDSLTIVGASQLRPAACPEQSPITVWLAGDSTVANGITNGQHGWGRYFDNYFNDDVTVINSAAGGRSVRTWGFVTTDTMVNGECAIETNGDGSRKLEDRWQYMLDNMQAGDYLFIQFGINDGSTTCPRHVGSNAFKNHYIEMAKAAQERGAQTILLTPVSGYLCQGSTAVMNRGFITETMAVGSQLNIPVIHLTQLSVNRYNELGLCPGTEAELGGNSPAGLYFYDRTHFEPKGADDMAGVIAKALKTQFIPLAEYVK